VEQGTELARIDDALYKADYEQAVADLGTAQANVQRAEADLDAMRSKLSQTERDWVRARQLRTSNSIAAVDYDTAQNAWETAKAAIPSGEAAVVQAKKAVERSQAALNRAKTNLGYCIIKSPVKGTIVDRRVNIGQTVISSLNAPSLFLLAKDLTKMQVWASVNEADIGQVYPNQDVRFTVDAYPGAVFKGTVDQVRLNANMTQNVVTYTVAINTNNEDRKLLPYMTANVQFLVSEKQNVLKVPNAALRWRPQPQEVAPAYRDECLHSSRRSQSPGGDKQAEKERHEHGMLWVKEGRFVRPIEVRPGLSDGVSTEITGKDVEEGMQVVIREVQAGSEAASATPFTPQLFGGGRKQQ
jgi:HlyD family secretion protein